MPLSPSSQARPDPRTSGRLVLVTGKGGVGKTTVAAALALRLAQRGKRVLLLEIDPRERAHRLLGLQPSGGELLDATPGLALLNLRPRHAITALLRRHVRPRALLAAIEESAVYEQLVEGCPGLREVAVLGHALETLQPAPRNRAGRASSHQPAERDVVVLDAPATGHGLALLEAPGLLAAVVSRGPLGELASRTAALIADSTRCRVVAVSLAEELPVTETLELRAALDHRLHRSLDTLVVNALWPDAGPGSKPPREPRASARQAPSTDPALELLDDRLALQRAQLERLRRAWEEPSVELPLLPLDAGLDLCDDLAHRLDDVAAAILAGPVPTATSRGRRPKAARAESVVSVVSERVPRTAPRNATRSPQPALSWVDRLPELVIVVGGGGVGKTTLAAAIAVASAEVGRPTLAMTFDPARRLRDALGIDADSVEARQRVRGVDGRLDASLLDTRSTFDRLIERYAPDDASRQRIQSNPFYRQLGGSLAGILEYMAVERLFEESASGEHERIVLDTPPIRHALEFLDAPRRIVGFLDSGVRRIATREWFDAEGRLRVAGPFRGTIERAIDELVGLDFVRNVLEFFGAFEPLFDGFRDRALEVERLLRSERTTFVIVTGPGEAAVPDVLYFARQLALRGHSLERVLVNRVHPVPLPLPKAAQGERDTARALMGWLAARDVRGLDRLRELLGEHPCGAVPLLGRDPSDLDGLRQIARRLNGP